MPGRETYPLVGGNCDFRCDRSGGGASSMMLCLLLSRMLLSCIRGNLSSIDFIWHDGLLPRHIWGLFLVQSRPLPRVAEQLSRAQGSERDRPRSFPCTSDSYLG